MTAPETRDGSATDRDWRDDHGHVASADRMLAGIAYIAVMPFIIIASRPGPRFIQRHQYLAALIHFVRIIWTGSIVGLWWLVFADGPSQERSRSFMIDMASIILLGTPWITTYETDALPWLLTPMIVTWSLSLTGLALALTGHTADPRAFANADWSDPVPRRRFLFRSAEEERRLARRGRERQLARLQRSSQSLRNERSRRDRIDDLDQQVSRLELQRDYYDQLLSLGEMSQRRYQAANHELDEEIAELKAQLTELTARVAINSTPIPQSMRTNRLARPEETAVETIAIVTPDGVPIFTYGQFQLDEAIVAGILSAFDSLSEEVFGSRVNKTMLAGGQVLFFAHGQHVLVMAIFNDEPAPRQVEELRTMLLQFEQANSGPLARKQYDPAYLHQVEIPFKFIERLPRPN